MNWQVSLAGSGPVSALFMLGSREADQTIFSHPTSLRVSHSMVGVTPEPLSALA